MKKINFNYIFMFIFAQIWFGMIFLMVLSFFNYVDNINYKYLILPSVLSMHFYANYNSKIIIQKNQDRNIIDSIFIGIFACILLFLIVSFYNLSFLIIKDKFIYFLLIFIMFYIGEYLYFKKEHDYLK